MLDCDFCGCYSPRPEQGWVAYPGNEDPAIDAPGVLVYCPSCAEAVFNHPSAAAAEHVCIWKPQAGDTHGPRVGIT